ncbi:hypothetical protein LS73_000160 [Helicobacter muridarum]|uniref:Uncharacterized protein n=1 Tax=Helicobacter muridarum TaxID=216 RepID=A0A099TY87_9HELI|nr:hypothetical protein [Helicobacter muridarum]TLE01596.1 hypothetical protein LS73_000160 [Helicobacter muridarum]STQ86210.1 Uncharacterised protein [Helicobacter muridarum]
MKILRRGEIVIIESNLSDDTQLFDKNAQYRQGDIVVNSKSKYKAKVDVINQNLNNAAYWEWIDTSNEWACFDYYLNTSSYNKDCIDISFACVGANAIYIAGLQAKMLLIEVIDIRNNQITEQQEFKLYGNMIASWSEYFFGNWKGKQKSNIYYERTTYTRNVVFRIRAYGLRDIAIGSIICGELIDIAMTLYAKNSISMLDFSKVESDERGYTQLTRGNFKRTNAFEVLVEDRDMDRVSFLLSELRGEAIVFVIADYFENLINFGFLKNHEILLEKVGRSIVSIEIEGLI